MDSISGDQWIAEYARWVRIHEARLGDVGRRVVSNGSRGPAHHARSAAPTTSSAIWNVVSLGIAAPNQNNAPKPLLLKLNPHNLYYLLIRFEALTLPVGPLDVKIPAAARPTTSFSWISAQAGKDRDDTMSLSSIRTGLSVVSSSFTSASSWFNSTPARQDPNREIKYLYSSFTKIPNLYLGPIPPRKLIQDFEDSPGQSSVPMDVFKNLQLLELDDVDPRTLIGWDRLSVQLRSLTCKRSSVEDLSDLLIDLVINDGRRRRGEKVSENRSATLKPEGPAESSSTDENRVIVLKESEPFSNQPEMPSHAWQFLRYLNLSTNNLTFIPSEPLLCLSALTNLDLSSNLLNLVPPSLSHLSALTSLNISDNLIDSVLGIYDTLKGIRVLNIAKNRLESLCGLERLYTLERIDLRTNNIYEAGEVGRLATLPRIKEVWVRDNPLVEELVDYRVECYLEFARERRTVILDGEAPGFFEKQRIAERVPPANSVETSTRTYAPRTSTDRAKDEQEARLANGITTLVKNVRHRGAVGSSFAVNSKTDLGSRSGSNAQPSLPKDRGDKGGHTAAEKGSARRRNQRLVELDTSPSKSSKSNTNVDAIATSMRHQDEARPELSDSDFIKQAAQSGDNAGALESPDPKRGQAASASYTQTHATGPKEREKLTWSRQADTAAAALSAEMTTHAPKSTDLAEMAHTRSPRIEARDASTASAQTRPSTDGAMSPSMRSEALRKKIEALKSEVGDDWLRLLSRGDAAHLASESLEGAKSTDSDNFGGSSVLATHVPSTNPVQVSRRAQSRGKRRDANIT